jgi:hypothetical protein
MVAAGFKGDMLPTPSSQTQVRALLKQADLFVMSSFAEGLPLCLWKLWRLAYLWSPRGSPAYLGIVRDEHKGLLIPPSDAKAVAQEFVAYSMTLI